MTRFFKSGLLAKGTLKGHRRSDDVNAIPTFQTVTVEYDVKVTGNISDDELDTIKQLCEHSPVYGLLVEAIPLRANVTRG